MDNPRIALEVLRYHSFCVNMARFNLVKLQMKAVKVFDSAHKAVT